MANIALFPLALLSVVGASRVIDFEVDVGAVAGKDDIDTWWANGKLLNLTLNSLQPGDTFVIPNKTFHVMGGIRADNVTSVTIQIDGTITYANDMKHWPRGANGNVKECWYGEYWENVTFTSSLPAGNFGTFDGQGAKWWGVPGIGYLELGENRPRLMHLFGGKNLLFEKIFFKNSPYWTFDASDVDGLEVRHCKIEARRTDKDGHGVIDITAFNTDGFDVSGNNVWIHDSSVWNQDDCIAVKGDRSTNMLFERIEASGLGLVIGSVGGGAHHSNITFRDIHMHKTVKGIYTKFRESASVDDPALIENVTFENIVMDEPEQYAIWIGPAQQSDSSNPCASHGACSLCWPSVPGAKCQAPTGGSYKNIVLRNITVNSAAGSPGIIMGSQSAPMEGIVFEDVKFNNLGSSSHFGMEYLCQGVAAGVAKGSTFPVPQCFKDETNTCIGDGSCSQGGRTCCSGGSYSTMNCKSRKRCGCVAANTCATHQSDCCSGSGHKTLKCSAGVGYRCDSSTSNISLVV